VKNFERLKPDAFRRGVGRATAFEGFPRFRFRARSRNAGVLFVFAAKASELLLRRSRDGKLVHAPRLVNFVANRIRAWVFANAPAVEPRGGKALNSREASAMHAPSERRANVHYSTEKGFVLRRRIAQAVRVNHGFNFAAVCRRIAPRLRRFELIFLSGHSRPRVKVIAQKS